MRCAIWSAVSTHAQAAPDKISVKLQIEKGRQLIASKGWHNAGEYIVPGESRTRYVSLYHAEKEIEPLHQLLEAAARREFDLLFVYDLNRFRHLMRQIFDVLCDYNIQIYVHTHPREPVPPDRYTDEIKTAVGMIVDVSNLISRSEINTLSRHFREKMPDRIRRGLHAGLGGVPYGYRKIHPLDKINPFVQEPAEARTLIDIKDWYLQGMSLHAIAAKLNQQNIRAPRGGIWHPQTIKVLLLNPYYAGTVFFSLTIYQRDRRTGKEIISKNPNPVFGAGKHIPLWDNQTHQQILSIMERRGQGYRGKKTRRLTSLLRCANCGGTLHADKLYYHPETPVVWRCVARTNGHTFIRDSIAIDLIIPKIISSIRKSDNVTIPHIPQKDPAEKLQSELNDLDRKKQRWMDLYENESIDPETLSTRLAEIKTQTDSARSLLAKTNAMRLRKETAANAIQQLRQVIDILPTYYTTAPAQQVNTELRTIIEHITITLDHQIEIKWRT